MTELEKVIKGLECCSVQHGNCGECPYYDPMMGMFDSDCKLQMQADALALLKEQEPRVLTLDDVCGGGECWIEYKYGGHGYADVYLEEPDGTALVYRCKPVGDRKPETVWLHDYGKLWRGWNYRPSPEQMRETPWEGDAE